MAILNRILNFLILVLAIAALGIGFMLATHRQATKERADVYRDAVVGVVDKLDPGSGTNLTPKVTKDALEWRAYKDNPATVKGLLDEVAGQAAKVHDQRDKLADSAADLGKKLGYEEIDPADLKNVASYEEKLTALGEYVAGFQGRDQALVAKLEELAPKVGATVAPGDLAKTDAYQGALDNFSTAVATTAQRADRLKSTLETMVSKIGAEELGMDPAKVENATPAELEKLLAKVDELGEAVRQNKKLAADLADSREKAGKLEERVGDAQNSITDLNTRIGELTAKVKDLQDRLDIAAGPGGPEKVATGPAGFDGKIVNVNYEWNYVIIDLGAKNALQPNTELTVSRDREFICNVKVSRVYKDYAVAEILPELQQGNVLPGDRVFYLAN